MKVIVTGAAGYIGSVLCPMLEGAGHEIRRIDLILSGDVRAGASGTDWGWADAVIPLAAIVGAPACAAAVYDAVTTNAFAISYMLSELFPRKTKVIFPATDSGYPTGNVNEDSPMNPQSLYAKTKYDAECAVLGEGGVSLRLASVFGTSPSMRWDLIVNSFVKAAASGKKMSLYEANYWRNFVHITDVCRAFIHALNHYDEMQGEPYNVGNPYCSMTKETLCYCIRKHVPSFEWEEVDAATPDPDRRDSVVSVAKMLQTGWNAKVEIHDGIRELINASS